jgi:hypothetical protein
MLPIIFILFLVETYDQFSRGKDKIRELETKLAVSEALPAEKRNRLSQKETEGKI